MRKALASALAWVLLSAGLAGAADLLKIPKPTDKLDPPPPPPKLDASVMSLLVSAPLELLEQAIDAAMPAEEGEEKRWLDGSQLVGKPGFQYQFRIWRGKPQLKAIRDHLEVSFPDMKYRFRGRLAADSGPFGGGCGYDDPPKGLAPQGIVQLSWSKDGIVRTSTEFDPAAFPEICKLSPVDVDATPVIRKLVAERLPATGSSLDAALRARSLSKQRLLRLWKQLATPSEVEPSLWLTMRPTNVTAAPFTAETEKSIRAALSVMIRPTAVIGPRPKVAAGTLPPVRVAPVQPAGLHVALPIRVTYAELNRRLSKQLAGSAFDAGPLGKVKILSTYLYGSGDKVILQLDVEGGVNGRIYPSGSPAHLPCGRRLRRGRSHRLRPRPHGHA